MKHTLIKISHMKQSPGFKVTVTRSEVTTVKEFPMSLEQSWDNWISPWQRVRNNRLEAEAYAKSAAEASFTKEVEA